MLELLAKYANRSKILVYSTTIIDITITNSYERKETHYILFIVIDL
jgi:hypothetical protein